jgi:hypothetical protein
LDQLLGFRTNDHVFHMELLRFDAPSAITPRAATNFLRNRRRRVLRPKLSKNSSFVALGGFEAQTIKPIVSTTPHARPPRPDVCPASPRPRRQHGPLHHVLARVRVPGVSHHGWSSGCSGPSVKTKHSPFTALGPSARVRMTFTLSIDHCPCALHPHTTSRPTWLHKHNLTLWSVH